ncbi:MAG TPA: winged helix-turn-helix domain-containing protein [Candidatus Acidoferrum sp.]|nr:winged helix-turn-helix domain-containing protein [Candidatus Acidoferrum sp.]
MPRLKPSQVQVRFGDYHVDLRTCELHKHGQKVRLAGRPFQILALLLEQPGELLTRQELQSKLWPADTFVDFEHGVNAAVQTLRRALCDSHKKPRFIETLPRRGYRFIASIDTSVDALTSGTAPAVSGRPPARSKSARSAPAWVGQVATILDPTGLNYVLLAATEEILLEMKACEAAQDDLGISLMVADEKLLLVSCGTKVKILEASNPAEGCKVRILGGQFVGEKAFAPRPYLSGLP